MTNIEKTYTHKTVTLELLRQADVQQLSNIVVDLITKTLPEYELLEIAEYECGIHKNTRYELRRKINAL